MVLKIIASDKKPVSFAALQLIDTITEQAVYKLYVKFSFIQLISELRLYQINKRMVFRNYRSTSKCTYRLYGDELTSDVLERTTFFSL